MNSNSTEKENSLVMAGRKATPEGVGEINGLRGEKYWFEGEMKTVRQVRECVPVLSSQTVRARLRAGMTSRTEMLSFDPDTVRRQNGKRAARRYRAMKT